MRKSTFCLTIAALAPALAFAPLSQAKALCIYKGDLYAKTTMAQEYADSHWVVRARVTSETNSWTDARIDDDEAPWTTYRIEVLEAFKGGPPHTMTVFTWNDSGGFYLGPKNGAPRDPYEEYLLFLNPTGRFTDAPPEAAGTAMVNYNCGQSKPWILLTAEDVEAFAEARRQARR